VLVPCEIAEAMKSTFASVAHESFARGRESKVGAMGGSPVVYELRDLSRGPRKDREPVAPFRDHTNEAFLRTMESRVVALLELALDETGEKSQHLLFTFCNIRAGKRPAAELEGLPGRSRGGRSVKAEIGREWEIWWRRIDSTFLTLTGFFAAVGVTTLSTGPLRSLGCRRAVWWAASRFFLLPCSLKISSHQRGWQTTPLAIPGIGPVTAHRTIIAAIGQRRGPSHRGAGSSQREWGVVSSRTLHRAASKELLGIGQAWLNSYLRKTVRYKAHVRVMQTTHEANLPGLSAWLGKVHPRARTANGRRRSVS